MQVSLPRFGKGVSMVFSGGAMSVQPVSGRLSMAASNIRASSAAVKQIIAQSNRINVRA